jgi:hypothetical protein
MLDSCSLLSECRLVWQIEELEGETRYRAVLEGYLVFLQREPFIERNASKRKQKRSKATGAWFVHFLIPDEERERAYLAGEGFTSGTTLETAQRLAVSKARELRATLERRQTREAPRRH